MPSPVLVPARDGADPRDPLDLPWLSRVATAVAVALAVAFVIALGSGDGPTTASGRLGGDFPAFYTGGKLVRSDDRDRMYDFDVQAREQERYQPEGDDGWLYFPYPPHVALAYAPLSALPYRAAYALHTVLMVGAVALALHLVRPMLMAVDRHFGICVAGAVTFYPMYRAITGGQNTGLSLLLLAWSWRALNDGRPVVSGAALGLLLYKPQFALPIIGLHLLARRFRVVAGAAAVAAASWAVSAVLLGPDWVWQWWDRVDTFSKIDDHVQRRNVISFASLLRAAFGSDPVVPMVVAGVAIAATWAVVIRVWRNRSPRALALPMAIAAPALLLASPHALFYDAGLLVVPLAFLFARRGSLAKIAAVLWCAGVADVAKDLVRFTPTFLVTVAMFATLVVVALRQDAYARHRLRSA